MSESKAHCGKYPPDPRCMARQLAKTSVEVVKHGARTGHFTVSKEEQKRRMEICHVCEYFDKERNRCKLCGCYLRAKMRLSSDKNLCPDGRW